MYLRTVRNVIGKVSQIPTWRGGNDDFQVFVQPVDGEIRKEMKFYTSVALENVLEKY